MHWVLQNNLFHEKGYDELLTILVNGNIPHSLHKVIPFIGELEPDIELKNPVMVMGSYSMRHVAKKKNWSPGVFDLFGIDFTKQVEQWGEEMLNCDGIVSTFGDAKSHEEECFFMRPIEDSKYFPGLICVPEDLKSWQNLVVNLGEDDGTGLRSDTLIYIAKPKHIQQEIRCWVVDKKVITSSIYKIGSKVIYKENIDNGIIDYCNKVIELWNPHRAYVLDIAVVSENSYKIIEINTLNSCGLYAANVGKLVEAIEYMDYT